MDFERCFMPIRITCRAKLTDQRKCFYSQGVKISLAVYLKESYKDRNEKCRFLYGSI